MYQRCHDGRHYACLALSFSLSLILSFSLSLCLPVSLSLSLSLSACLSVSQTTRVPPSRPTNCTACVSTPGSSCCLASAKSQKPSSLVMPNPTLISYLHLPHALYICNSNRDIDRSAASSAGSELPRHRGCLEQQVRPLHTSASPPLDRPLSLSHTISRSLSLSIYIYIYISISHISLSLSLTLPLCLIFRRN